MAIQEFVFDDGVILVDDRVVELFGDYTDASLRLHVRMLGFEVYPPDKHGKMEVRVGLQIGDDVSARMFMHTGDEALRDACALALQAARQRGAQPPPS